MAPSNSPQKKPIFMGKEFYAQVNSDIDRGVDPNELVEMGYQSNLLSELTAPRIGELAAGSELLQTVETEPTMLEKFTARFSWVPRYEQEVNIAVRGIGPTLQGKRINRVEEIVNNIQGYATASNMIQHTLRAGLTDQKELSTVSAEKIGGFKDEHGHYGPKGRNAIVDALATEQLFQQEVLTGAGPWPHRSKDEGEISPKRLSPFVKMVNELSDEALVEMWQNTFNNQAQRAKFWLGMIREDDHQIHPRIQEVLREKLAKTHGAYRR